MPRPVRPVPRTFTAVWPEEPATDPIAEVARRFALNLRDAIGSRSIRSISAEVSLNHVTLLHILDGQVWPDMATIARLERGLDLDLWPGRL